MKHTLSLLCLTLIGSLFGVGDTSAQALVKYNHSSLELNSKSFSDNSYQVAGVYHIVDYNKNWEGRVKDGGKGGGSKNCATYGYVSSCPAGQKGTRVKPLPGLTCYKDCMSCATMGYVSSCPAGQKGTKIVVSGLTCYENCMSCATNGYVASCPSPQIGTPVTIPNGMNCYKNCQCPPIYNLSAQITANASCTSCTANGTTMWKCECHKGYTLSGDRCVKIENCNAYPLRSCPEGCNCSSCPDNNGKYKIDSAKTSDGWSWTPGQTTCPMTPCPEGYDRGVTSCQSGSSTPNYHKAMKNGQEVKSGGWVCGKCSCDNNTDCSGYTVSEYGRDNNANYSSCSTGCPAKTTYKFESCKNGFKLVDNVCVKINTCEDHSLAACPSHAICSECDGKYKFTSCEDQYYRRKRLSKSPTEVATESYTCTKCDGIVVKNNAACPTGYGLYAPGQDSDNCCIKLNSGSGGGNGCPDASKFKDSKGNLKQIYYQVIGGSSLGMYQWNNMGVPIEVNETCEHFKQRIADCNIEANIMCGYCICGYGKYAETCNGYYGAPAGGCKGSGGGNLSFAPNTGNGNLAISPDM